ncbi:hypothetical protein [Streptosporangium sp. CA-115845]|uniref:hypothetical protein n=1 Tax=Streptosporangium sp. CA-115845 TaxID=3240071 RepID=UPI003D9304D1
MMLTCCLPPTVEKPTTTRRERHFPVSEPVREHARLAMTGTQVSLGSVAGWIDQMSVRRLNKGVSSVSLFDPSTRRAVPGRLPAEMQTVVESMWRRRVLARGTVWRNDRGQVIKIDIEHLEPLPEEPTTPAPVSELLGIAPDWLGGQSVDGCARNPSARPTHCIWQPHSARSAATS